MADPGGWRAFTLSASFFVAAAENNLGLLLAVGVHRGLSNAAGRSGNDRDLAVQSTRLSVSWLSGTSAKSTFSHQTSAGREYAA